MIFVYKLNGIWFISDRRYYKFYLNSQYGKFINYARLQYVYCLETIGM